MTTKKLTFKYPEFIEPAFFDEGKFVCIRAARRAGKTYNASQWILDELLNPNIDLGNNPSGLWVDTTQSNIEKYVERYFKPILGDLWTSCHWRADKKILTLPNNTRIDFGSAERPELLEGFEYSRGVLNESGIILKKDNLWDNTLYPMFKGDYTKVRLIGTPKGKNKFFYLSKQYKSYHYTCFDTPYWNKAELDEIKSKIPEAAWRQEFLAEFLDGEGSVFRKISNIIKDNMLNTGSSYVMSCDLAKHQDFTVIMVANVNTKEIIYIDRFNQIDWSFQKQRILNTWNQFNRPRLIIDATGAGNPIYDDLKNAGLNIEPFIFTMASKKELIWDLAIAIDQQSIWIPNNQALIDELEAFGFSMSRSGNISYSAPDGLHDDMVIALALINKLLKVKNTVNLSFI